MPKRVEAIPFYWLWLRLLRVLRTLAMTTGCGFILLVPQALAYTDQIAVNVESVWKASREALKEYGIQKESAKKRSLETKWIEDRVTKHEGLLAHVAPKVYARRYKIRVFLWSNDYLTKVTVEGVFQRRQQSTRANSAWKRYKPDIEEYAIEREIFTKILKRLEAAGPQYVVS